MGFLCTLFLLIVVLVLPLNFTTGSIMSLSLIAGVLIIFCFCVTVLVREVVGEVGAVSTG